jgi:hypothetical protein
MANMNCYVDGGASEGGSICGPPYYLDNQSVLLNCRCESQTVPQLAAFVQAIGGAFGAGRDLPGYVRAAVGIPPAPFRAINGIPAKLVVAPFPGGTADFVAGEAIEVTVDSTARDVTFDKGSLGAAEVANRVNAAFADLDPSPDAPPHLKLPRVATADGFDGALTLEGWRGHPTGSVKLAATPTVLAKIEFGADPDDRDTRGYCQLLSAAQTSNVVFRGYSGAGVNQFGSSHQIEVQLARDGVRPVFWQARGADGDDHEFGVLRMAGPDVRRWAFTRASAERLVSLAFTMPQDSLGPDQVVARHGIWLEGSSRVLLCAGKPDAAQGRSGDIAWDMSANPPVQFVRKAQRWDQATAR